MPISRSGRLPLWRETLKQNYALAIKKFQQGKYDDALAVVSKLLAVDKSAANYALLAKTFLKLGMRAEAAYAFEEAGRLSTDRQVEYYGNAVKLHFTVRNPVETIRVGRNILREALQDPELAFPIAATMVMESKTLAGKADVSMFWDVLANSDNPVHRRLAIQSLTTAATGDKEYATGREMFKKHPQDQVVRSFFFSLAINANDYPSLDSLVTIINAEIDAGDLSFIHDQAPLINLRWNSDERINAQAGLRFSRAPDHNDQRRSMEHAWGDKLRIGYISSDFWDDHAVMKALGGILERHDRTKVDITLFCNTDQKHLERNQTDRSIWGNVVRIRHLNDVEAAQEIRNQGIDILVDLQGHTTESRVSVMNHPAAPIHVTWLGFPGTVINTDIDYLICDETVVPESSSEFYHEKLCRMPETFFPNDPNYRTFPKPTQRSVFGLPEDAFIFACYHASWKISPTTIDLWGQILARTEGSYLLMVCGEKFGSRENLLERLASRHGINPERVLFGARMHYYAAHMDRIPLADLGLDTFPYNGHTTTSEKLWCGLPMLTHKGSNFASRVSESLLKAIGLPEMVCDSTEDYIARAVHYFHNRDELAGVRERLVENRFTQPLFDADRFCRHLESAYGMMAERAKAGLAPDHLKVPALPPRTTAFSDRTA